MYTILNITDFTVILILKRNVLEEVRAMPTINVAELQMDPSICTMQTSCNAAPMAQLHQLVEHLK